MIKMRNLALRPGKKSRAGQYRSLIAFCTFVLGILLAQSISAQQQATAQAQGIRLTVLQAAKSQRADEANIIVEIRNLTDQESDIFAMGTVSVAGSESAFLVVDNMGSRFEGRISGIPACRVAHLGADNCFNQKFNETAFRSPAVIDPQGSTGMTISARKGDIRGGERVIGDTIGVTAQFAVRRGGERAQWRIISINLANIRL
jgi:hypothetical protein